MACGLVAVLLQILHKGRAAGSVGCRVVRAGLTLLLDVGRRVLEMLRAEIAHPLQAIVVGFPKPSGGRRGVENVSPNRRPGLDRSEEGAMPDRHVVAHPREIDPKVIARVLDAERGVESG